jgi:SAM-dependent methyltransferase
MSKKYLNIGCGGKFHKDWTNIDIVSFSPEVKSFNLLKGLPFGDNTFDVVYHSQVLEHIPKDKADYFIDECYRVLKPNGIIRISTPNLESITKEYLKWVEYNSTEKRNDESIANYEWMKIEMYDQIARNKPGGEMWSFLKSIDFSNHPFIANRIGEHLISSLLNAEGTRKNRVKNIFAKLLTFKQIGYLISNNSIFTLLRGMITHLLPENSLLRIGLFRTGGEVHYVMYDRVSLSILLQNSGFKNTEVKTVFDSNINGFHNYELEIKDGIPYDTTSLFMEASK